MKEIIDHVKFSAELAKMMAFYATHRLEEKGFDIEDADTITTFNTAVFLLHISLFVNSYDKDSIKGYVEKFHQHLLAGFEENEKRKGESF